MANEKILLIEDEKPLCLTISRILTKAGYWVESCYTGEEGIEKMNSSRFDLVLTDLRLPGSSGLDILREVKQVSPDTAVFLMTSFSTVDTVVEALREGAKDYISKPFDHNELLRRIDITLNHLRLSRENRLLKKELEQKSEFGNIIGETKQMADIFTMIRKVSNTESNVLILGESGTGKELIARAIHSASKIKDRPFVPINCSALPDGLLETELFGHVKGAFTGAIATKIGLFEEARDGTLFLDEIGEISPHIQVKLLRAIQEKEIKPVGGNKYIKVHARIISATNKELKAEIQNETFREDLYYRINVIQIKIPPLRERKEDINALCRHFINRYCKQIGKKIRTLHPKCLEYLEKYQWPGNVRELENVIERAVILEESDILTPESLPDELVHFSPDVKHLSLDKQFSIDQYIQNFIKTYGDQYKESELAKMLGISRKTLWDKRKKMGLRKEHLVRGYEMK